MGIRPANFVLQERRELSKFRATIEGRLRRIVQGHGVAYFVVPKDERYTVLRLVQLEERYMLPAEEWIPPLVDYLRAGRRTMGLGVRIAQLFGPSAEEWLLKYIQRTYPEGEHRMDWDAHRKQYTVSRKLATMFDPQGYVKEIERRRSIIQKQKQVRKPYRGSPWL